MFKSNENTLLSKILKIADKLKGSSLDNELMSEISGNLSEVAAFIHQNEECALFFSIIFVLQNEYNHPVNMHNIAEYLEYPFIRLIEFRKNLDVLEKAGLIQIDEKRNSSHHSENNGYHISGTILNYVIEEIPIPEEAENKDSFESFFFELNDVFEVVARRKTRESEFYRQILEQENRFYDHELVKNAKALFDDWISRMMIYYLSCVHVLGKEEAYTGNREDSDKEILIELLPMSKRLKRGNELRKGKDSLITDGFIKWSITPSTPFRHCGFDFSLTSKAVDKLFGSKAADYAIETQEKNETEKTIDALHVFAYFYEKKDMDIPDKHYELKYWEKKFQDLKFFATLGELVPNQKDRWFLLDATDDFVCRARTDLCLTLRDIFGHSSDYYSKLREFLDEKHILVKEGFVELEKNPKVEEMSVTISDRVIELLYGENADIYKKNVSGKNIVEPEKLKDKELFYSAEVQEQIDMMAESLKQDSLEAMQKRLEEKGLCKGISGILYGAPGTGKTESVYQLAKKTNRQIFHVDIADSKSMWFGESEKQIKKIFTNYKNLCNDCKRHGKNTPILLFNEADAIISKRKTVENGSNVDQTENSMQNILLEEMEKLEGILIATTNLCVNMDKAFERRFLFKVKFEKPSVENRMKIWKSKMPELKEEDALLLASSYDFSGGEIDNVVRKCEMNEIIKGKRPDLEEIKMFCSRERLETEETRHIGFGA